MSQNIIDVSWDLAKFDAQTQAVLANMTKVYELANQVSGIKPGSTGGYTELKNNVQELNQIQENTLRLTKLQDAAEQQRLKTQAEAAKTTKAQEAAEQQRLKTQSAQLDLTKKQADADNKLTNAQKESAAKEKLSNTKSDAVATKSLTEVKLAEVKATLEQEKTDAVRIKSLIAQERELERLIALEEKQKAAQSKNITTIDGGTRIAAAEDVASPATTAAFEAQRKMEAEASMAEAEYGNSVNKSTTAIIDRGKESNKADYDALKLAAMKKQAELKAAQELKNSAREQLAAKGSLEQRRAALIRLTATYDKLNATERNSASGVRLKGIVSGLTDQVKALEVGTGRAQRNVGNYTRSVAKAFTTGYNQLRKLAYLIPGIGVGGLVLLMIDPIISLYKWLNKATGAAQLLAQNQQNLNEVMSEGNKQGGKEVEDLKLVYDATRDLTLSVQERTKAAKFLQDTYPDTFKNFTAEQIMVGDAAKGYDALAASILKAALASAARTKIEALAAQKLDIDFTKAKIKNNLANKNLAAKDIDNRSWQDKLDDKLGIGSDLYKVSRDRQIAGNNIKAAADLKEQDDANAKLDQQIKFLTDFAGKQALADSIIDEKKTKKAKGKKGTVTMDSTKEQLDAEFELYKISQQRKIKLLDEEQNDTKKSLMERMLAAEDFTKASMELSDKTYQHEIDNDKKKLEALKANYKKAKGTEKNNLAVDIDNATKEITIAQAKQSDARIDIQNAFGKKYLEIAKDTEAERLRILEEAEKSIKNLRTNQQGAIDAIQATELGSLDKLLKEKLIDQEEYNKRKAKFENDALILSLQSQLTEEKGLRDIAKLKGESVIDYDNKITELTGKLLSAQNGGGKKPPKSDESELNKRQEIVKDAQLITSTIDSLVDIGYQKEIDAIQKIIDLNEQRKEREIANINASTLSNQEKAAKMLILDNTVAANNKKLEREKVAIQIKQAKFDRDMAVLSILENVAGANFKLIAQGGFAGIAAGIAVGLEATAAIAMLLAKPLPQMPAYAKGTDNHPGGPAIVGEGIFKELVSGPNGSFIADRPMLLNNLPKGSKVTPLTKDMVMAGMQQSANLSMAERIVQSNNIQAEGNRIELSAIKDAVYETGRMTAQALRKQKGANVVVNVDSKFYAHIMKVVKE